MEKKNSRIKDIISHHKIIKSISGKRVDYNSAVKDFYIADDLAYISCNVRSYSDIIDSYSVREYAWPKKEFADYVEANACNIPSEYPIVLELCGTKFSQKQQGVITKALTNYYALKLGETQESVRKKNVKEMVLLALTILSAIALVAFWMLLNTRGLLEETLIIVFWFFLWEWGDVVAFERRQVRRKRNDAAQLASIRILFSERFVDEPLEEEIKEEIIEELITHSANTAKVSAAVSAEEEAHGCKIIPIQTSRRFVVSA